MEWIDPRYAEVVAAMRLADGGDSDAEQGESRPVRGFIVLTDED